MCEKISIIIPVYNVEKYLHRCIQSVVKQTYTNLEIILVDDGSSDRSPKICDEWSQRDSRIKVIHQNNAGVSAARNAGIQAAEGEYLYFVDGDDWIAPDLCEKVMDTFSKNDVDIVVFNCERISESGKRLGATETLIDGVLNTEDALKALMKDHINSYVWNKICKYKVFQDISFPERSAFEDLAIAHKLILNANQIYCLNEQLYFYYQRNGSATSNIDAQKFGELFLSRCEVYAYIKILYPDIAEMIFPKVALTARRLYDRSLWEMVDKDVLNEAVSFLRDNKQKILSTKRVNLYCLYYSFPYGYKMFRVLKHIIGNMVRALQKRGQLSH